MSALLVRLAILAALALAGWESFLQYTARRIYRTTPGIDGVLGAIEWDSTRSKYHAEAGVLFRDELETMDLERAVFHLERAVELHPYRSAQWVELARAYERAGRTDDAERAYLRSLELEQPATDYRWEVGNFYMLLGRPDMAFPQLQRALAEEPEYMEPALALLLRGGYSLVEIERAWPQEPTAKIALLALAARAQASGRRGVGHDDIVALWERLLSADPPPAIEAGDGFVRHLIETGRHAEARRAWTALAAENGLVDPDYAAGANDVWDGGFEQPVVPAMLAWYSWPGEGFEVARAPGEGIGGTTALRIRFDGRHNVHFGHVHEAVLLEPGERYEIEYRAKSDSLTTEERPSVEVFDPRTGNFLYRGPAVAETSDWESHADSFDVPADCATALVRVVRQPSRRIANQISGTFWLDDVVLRQARLRANPGSHASFDGGRQR